ncbi:MAG: SRPBCC family protein [Bacteroidota bacterium]
MYTAKQSISIVAPRTKVWEALTKPELVKKYFFGTTVESNWKKGDPIKFTGEWDGKQYEDKGVVIDIEKDKLLKYSYYSSWSGKPDLPENYHYVTYLLNDLGGSTVFVVEQEGLETEEAKEHTEKNWASIMQDLRKLLEENQSKY